MTASEIRSAIAIYQAELAILSDNARALDEIGAMGQIDLAGERLRDAYLKLEGAARLRNEPPSHRFLVTGEVE